MKISRQQDDREVLCLAEECSEDELNIFLAAVTSPGNLHGDCKFSITRAGADSWLIASRPKKGANDAVVSSIDRVAQSCGASVKEEATLDIRQKSLQIRFEHRKQKEEERRKDGSR